MDENSGREKIKEGLNEGGGKNGKTEGGKEARIL